VGRKFLLAIQHNFQLSQAVDQASYESSRFISIYFCFEKWMKLFKATGVTTLKEAMTAQFLS
jgi:hypothetical protein